ncbi:unnamed protein product, partial [Didymodactylos carnosus]
DLLPIDGYQNMPLVSLEEAVKPVFELLKDDQLGHKIQLAKRQCSNPENNLTQDESASIRLYTMEATATTNSLYYRLNDALRAVDRQKLKPWFCYLKLFLTALFKLPSVKGSVWRGVKLNLSNLYKKKRTWTWWGISSCTDSKDVLESPQFLGNHGTRTLCLIQCVNGKDIRAHSFFPNENEILLLPATQFAVKRIEDQGDDLHFVELEEIVTSHPLLMSPTKGVPSSKEPSIEAKFVAELLTTNKASENFLINMTVISNEDAELLGSSLK